MHALLSFFQDRKPRIFEKELWAVSIFIICSAWISSTPLYFLLIILLFATLYLLTRNLLNSLWITFLPVFLFYRAVYFSEYFVAFSDPLLLLLLLVLWLRRKTVRPSVSWSNNLGIITLVMITITILGLLSSWYSKFSDISFFYLLQLVKFFVVYLISKTMFANRSVTKVTIEILLIFALFNSTLIVLQNINRGPLGLPVESHNLFIPYGRYADEIPSLYRPGGISTSPNEMSSVLGMMIPVLFSLGLTKNTYHKHLVWLCLFLSIAAVFYTAARAVWIVVALSLPFVFSAIGKSGAIEIPSFVRKYWKAVVVVMGLLFSPLLIQRVLSAGELLKAGGGGIYRLRHFVIAADIMNNFPLGVGMNVFQYAMTERFNADYFFHDSTPAHNVFAEVGADFGALGIPLFVILYYCIVKEVLPSVYRKRPISIGVFWGIIIFLALSQVHPWLFERSASSLFWVLGGYVEHND